MYILNLEDVQTLTFPGAIRGVVFSHIVLNIQGNSDFEANALIKFMHLNAILVFAFEHFKLLMYLHCQYI